MNPVNPGDPEPTPTAGLTGASGKAPRNSLAFRARWPLALALFALTVAVFWPAVRHPFMAIDDSEYVTDHPFVPQGLRWVGIGLAFVTRHAGNWHPLTTLSHMLDCQLFGLDPAGHHLVNILVHAGSAALLFGLLHRLTGALWRSALAAAFFAIHPLRVESVAWVSERKDVLSVFFFLLTLWAYTRYAGARSQPSLQTQSTDQPAGTDAAKGEEGKRRPNQFAPFLLFPSAPFQRFFWLALFFSLLGLMSKPM
ncbi:MAG: hypothetical protein RMK20_15250, partial [Verrucomicrobiales bacterium]|nr:hypothetical protein [Verrucomicrobiales bacterium]